MSDGPPSVHLTPTVSASPAVASTLLSALSRYFPLRTTLLTPSSMFLWLRRVILMRLSPSQTLSAITVDDPSHTSCVFLASVEVPFLPLVATSRNTRAPAIHLVAIDDLSRPRPTPLSRPMCLPILARTLTGCRLVFLSSFVTPMGPLHPSLA